MKKSTLFQIKDKNPLRKCVELILRRDLKKIKNKTILEIGCGKWGFAKKLLEKNNKWFGLEPVDFKNNLTIIKGSVKKIPFHDNSFDYILCNQTMEHWFEYGVSMKKALKEINRVLKNNGILMINSPIYNHGHPFFLRGKLRKIANQFDIKMWKITLFERCIPSKKIKGWIKLGGKGWQSKIGYPNFLIPKHKNKYSYIINIHAKKIINNQIKTKNSRLRPLIVILRFLKKLIFI